MTIDFLDRTLLHLKEIYTGEEENSKTSRFTNDDYYKLQKAWQKLEKDGYVYSKKDFVGTAGEGVNYSITFDGLIALESPPLFWKNRPYRWKLVKEGLVTLWDVGKVVVIFFNAVVLLLLAILTYIKQ